MADNTVQIQVQDSSGNWRTYAITGNHPLQIVDAERKLAEQFPGYRIRAVDMNGKLVDIY